MGFIDGIPPEQITDRVIADEEFDSYFDLDSKFTRRLVQQVVDEGLAALAATPRCELIAGFAAFLPIRVITRLLGLPAEDAGRIKAWSDAWVEPLGYGLSLERELEVAVHLSRGDSNKHVAYELDVSISTVAHHVRAILGKLGLGSRVELVRLLRQLRVDQISPEDA